MYSHEAKKKFKCDQCGKAYTYFKNCRRHMLTHKNSPRFECHVCRYLYASRMALREHMETHKNDPSLTCKMCNKQFWSAARFKQHTEHNHENRFTCEICLRGFPRKASLKRHQEMVHTERAVYNCDECGFSTSILKSFDLHRFKHANSVELEKLGCDFCDFVSFDERNLKRHRQLHDDSRLWYQCSLCDFHCRMDSTLRAHIFKVHGGIKDFKCEECGLTFMTKLLLEVHVKKHAVTKYRCGVCLKYFIRGYALRRHSVTCMVKEVQNDISNVPVETDPLAINNTDELTEKIDEEDTFDEDEDMIKIESNESACVKEKQETFISGC